MDGEQRRGRLSSFVVGGLVGASAALAAARRRRRRVVVARRTPQGLEAFEGAPCYHEVVEREREEL
jgi:thioredoxin reductase